MERWEASGNAIVKMDIFIKQLQARYFGCTIFLKYNNVNRCAWCSLYAKFLHVTLFLNTNRKMIFFTSITTSFFNLSQNEI